MVGQAAGHGEADDLILAMAGGDEAAFAELWQRYGGAVRGLGLVEPIREAVRRGIPMLGICIGMQMLASRGLEYDETGGFDWIGGTVEAIKPEDATLKVPHMGWNDLVIGTPHPVLEGVSSGDHAYFVHSYHFRVTDPAHLVAHVDYGTEITAVVGRDNIVGTQFHPEKSQSTGLRMIANFLSWKP